jgi:hypothetical protein
MNRFLLINDLIGRYGYTSYLELGCFNNECFSQIKAKHKTGVDPQSGGTVRLTSDAFFRRNALFWNRNYYDIIFIDGLHYSVQVCRDIENSLRWLNKGGTIVMHDCNPVKEEEAVYPYAGSYTWNGDVWKAFTEFRKRPDLDMVTGDFDHGCGIIQVKPNTAPLALSKPMEALTWNDLVQNRQQWLRLMSYEEILNWLK